MKREIEKGIYYVGASTTAPIRFENVYPIPKGVSYNSYLVRGEKTALLDTIDAAKKDEFFENVNEVLDGAAPDYIVVHHMEPDHSAALEEAMKAYPNAKIVLNAKSLVMIKQFCDFDDARALLVKEGDSLDLGGKTLTFYLAPMVHWPEVMVSFEETTKTLFSADAFGTFGAMKEGVTDSENAFDESEYRRYYANIVGKYGAMTTSLLKKAAALPIKRICPLHGPVLTGNIQKAVDLYTKWGAYQPEEQGLLILKASVYGHTYAAVEEVVKALKDEGVTPIKEIDVCDTDVSYAMAEAFRASHILVAAPTYNAGLYTPMENALNELALHGLANRTFFFIENGSWAPFAAKKAMEMLAVLKNTNFGAPVLTLRSRLQEEQGEEVRALAKAIAESLRSK